MGVQFTLFFCKNLSFIPCVVNRCCGRSFSQFYFISLGYKRENTQYPPPKSVLNQGLGFWAEKQGFNVRVDYVQIYHRKYRLTGSVRKCAQKKQNIRNQRSIPDDNYSSSKCQDFNFM